MAYDEDLAHRFRCALEGMAGISEKRMMGGVCFFLDGNMIGAADRTKAGEGRYLFRVGKAKMAEALTRDGAQIMMQGARQMTGFVFVGEDACEDDAAFRSWVSMALGHASGLPPK